MKILKKIILVACLFPLSMFSQTETFKMEKATSFYPNASVLERDNIEWRYLTLPENWNIPNGKQIKLAVAVLKNTSNNADPNPVLFIEGGPGAGGISRIWNWLDHPLREKSDIVLVDVRGTGNSLPGFCPDLGKKFLEILSKNNTSDQDEEQKAIAAVACKDSLLKNNIDIHAYNSESIAKDLNALKQALNYKKWNVYGVSYGTFMAQVYAAHFPVDVRSLVLDSPISDISKYYSYNSTNYMNSLKKVFEACKNNPVSAKQYPDLEKTYFETIDRLESNPVTVKVDKRIIESGNFTYNAEDFKIAIQQSLYNKDLIEVLPLLITAFHEGNKRTLSTLVSSFSGALGLDYGMYYCVTCDEVIPFNSIAAFEKDANQYVNLKGGLSFYKSDFSVCNAWNATQRKVIDTVPQSGNLLALQIPVLVFSGGFDPITPAANGKMIIDHFKKGFLINALNYGHAPGYSRAGREATAEFVNNPTQQPEGKGFLTNNDVKFITGVKINGGLANFASSLNEFNYLFFAPLLISFCILFVSIFGFIYLFIKNKKIPVQDKVIRFLAILTSVLGLITIIGFIMAVDNTVKKNFFILAFGLPEQFNYLFILQWTFICFALISLLYFILKIRSLWNAPIVFSVLFSIILFGVYFQYWGFLF